MTAAELGAVPPTEQDALYELAARRLDTGRPAEAATLLAALVTLFPYTARFWRAYGIACHRLLELRRAAAAYDAALLLEPGHLATLCYRGEIRVYLGERHDALDDLQKVAAADNAHLARRAEELMDLLDRLRDWRPPERPRIEPPKVHPFTLPDGRSLPLDDGHFDDDDEAGDEVTAAGPGPITKDVTDIARVFAPEVTQRIVDIFEEPPLPRPMLADRTAPGPLPAVAGRPDGTSEVTGTDLIAGRPAALALEDHIPTRPFGPEITRTGLVRRRAGLPLSFDVIEDEESTGLLPDRGPVAVPSPVPAPEYARPISRGQSITIDVPGPSHRTDDEPEETDG